MKINSKSFNFKLQDFNYIGNVPVNINSPLLIDQDPYARSGQKNKAES